MRDIIQIEIKSTASGKVDLINILIDFLCWGSAISFIGFKTQIFFY